MKHTNIFNILWFLLIPFLVCQFTTDLQAQGVAKIVPVGYFHAKITDSGDEGEGSWGWDESRVFWQNWEEGLYSSKAICFGTATQTDTNGVVWTPKVTTHGQWENEDLRIIMPIADENGFTIHRYLRYPIPAIEVDGLRLEDPYPFNLSDHVDPAKLPGTSDCFIESFINTDMGFSIHQEIIYFTQKNHEKYTVRKFTIKNTGNGDTDPTIEYPNQVLQNFYMLVQQRPNESPKPWMSYYGEMPQDSLRFTYGYPQRQEGGIYDTFGHPDVDGGTGFLRNPWFNAEATLFASTSADDPLTDDMNQPRMTGFQDVDLPLVTVHSGNLNSDQQVALYKLMQEGFLTYSGDPENVDARPGHHSVDIDERGFKFANGTWIAWFGYSLSGFHAWGPYTLDPGDSVIVIRADCFGAISPEKAFEVGNAWINNNATWPYAEDLPPTLRQFRDLMAASATPPVSQASNVAKDNWVYSGLDSVHQTVAAAQWAQRHDWNVPQPPPPPSISVTSSSDRIIVAWGSESEEAADFAGYRVYRAQGSWYPHVPDDGVQLTGVWQKVFETTGSSVHSWDDTSPVRGFSYYYYVTAFDNGSNPPDFHGRSEVLESAQFWNMTSQPAFLTKPGGTLATIRIVPNPFDYSGQEGSTRYPGEQRDQIRFFDVPDPCTIKIYSESGDLVKTIEHSGSGDASWGNLANEFQVTETGQVVVSGVYIAVFETPDGGQAIKKFVIIR